MARHERILYGEGFDIVRLPVGVSIDDDDVVDARWRELEFFEIKSTTKASVKPDWSGYFFSLSTAELLTAQSLKGQYKFAFVNVLDPSVEPTFMSLTQLFARANAVYPTWSISFGSKREAIE